MSDEFKWPELIPPLESVDVYLKAEQAAFSTVKDRMHLPMRGILACTKGGVIGRGHDTIPWRCKPDQRRFKELTMNNILILGYRTFIGMVDTWPEKSPIVLPGRDVIVLFGSNYGEADELAMQRYDVLTYSFSQNKTVGDSSSSRLLALPYIRGGTGRPEDEALIQERALRCITYDIARHRRSNQTVFVGGGAATYAFLGSQIVEYDVTIVDAEVDGDDLCKIYGAPSAALARAGLIDNRINGVDRAPTFHGEDFDQSSGVGCKYYTVSG